MSPASKAQQKAVSKYVKEKYDRIMLTMPKGRKDEIQTRAAAKGESLNGYVLKAVEERMEREGAAIDDAKEENGNATTTAE